MPSNLYKKPVILLLLIASCFAGGCWDMWELEERGIVLALGIEDVPYSEVNRAEGLEGELMDNISDRAAKFTYQFAIPHSTAGEQSSGGPAYYNMTTTSLASAIIGRGLAATRSSRKADLTHLQIIVLDADVARDGLYPVLERLMRDPDVRKQVVVVVTEDNVEQVLNTSSNQEPLPALYLTSLLKNSLSIHRMVPEITLGGVYRRIREGAAYVIPRLSAGTKDVKVAGGGIFNGDRLVGWLGEAETVIFRWITDELSSAPIVIASPASLNNKHVDGYLAERSKSTVTVQVEDDRIKFMINIDSRGSLLERQLQKELWDDSTLISIREEMANSLAEDVEKLIRKAQTEWKLDIFGFGRQLEIKYPRLWKEIKDEWHDRYFPGALVEVKVNITITRTGIIR